ncbi:hypothetical protein J2752_002248 [Halarchaeum rubridurum]|uniref:RecA-superfamily ATPase, KaiC/GvpD/RAD55 family n=1 Tax=Halarchaeum rubridurum TaxID=489911 RepID=A0A830G1V5_9EURY|nr:hypothetical protein [Halarchaeum rubridurum]MBP1955325.1 hypothetical protein [Halarchaeum rubridurum]GGM71480.1 hypothetical protein GCM10009017_21800 [Halarchaeum rubridurum]
MGAPETESAAFSRELAALKRRGCAVLVVDDRAHGSSAACERLLGGDDLERRHVFLTTATPVDDLLGRRAAGAHDRDPATLGVVDATDAVPTRSAAAASPSTTAPTPAASEPATAARRWYDAVETLDDLAGLYALVEDHVRRVAGDDTDPGELRFCLDALDPFLDAVDHEALFRFVHLLTSTVRDVDGMGHVHTASDPRNDPLATLEPLFDATVRVDAGPDGVRQRWTLTDSGIETDWFPLD